MIGFDLDGVLARTDILFNAWFHIHHKWDVIPTPEYLNKFDYACPADKTGKWIADEIGNCLTYWWDKIMPYHRNLLALKEIYLAGLQKEMFIVTARAPKTEKSTLAWCDLWIDVPHMVKTVGFHTGKLPTLMAMGIDCYVDDRYKTVQELAKGNMPYVFLLNQPWNAGRKTHMGVRRVNDLFDMHNILMEEGYYGKE